jgi:hypothetical protein
MFFDQLDERNIIVKSVLAFDKVVQVSLADLENRLSRLWLSSMKNLQYKYVELDEESPA